MANLGEWTVYDSETGDSVNFTAFLGAEVSNESKVITSPVEQGSFVAYNKVHSPAELTVTGAVKGEPADLTQAMELLDEMCNGTRLYNIVTPDRVYRDYNLYKLSYRRSVDDGTDLIVFDASFMEIRQTSGMYSTTTVATSGNGKGEGLAPRKQQGKQQPKSESFLHKMFS